MGARERDRLYHYAAGVGDLPLSTVGKRGPKPTKPCGTVAAYKRHRRAGEQPCAACAAAWAAEQRRLYANRKAQTTRDE